MKLARLIVFARCPDRGLCKTRLIPALGVVGATQLHEAFVRHTLCWATTVRDAGFADVEVHYSGEDLDRLRLVCGQAAVGLAFRPQRGDDLGERLRASFEAAFGDGCGQVAIIGTDCPELNASTVSAAFAQLEEHDVVLGPALDGGYYLVALRGPVPELFQTIAWGEPSVLETTLRRADSLRLRVGLLPAMADIDCPVDLGRLNEGWLESIAP